MKVQGIFYTIISAVLFGITPLLATHIYALGTSPNTLVFMRALMVIPILFLLMKKDHESLKISRHDLLGIMIVTMLGNGLTTILLSVSYQYINVGIATTLHFLYPIFVALLCRFVFREKFGRQKLLALMFAVFGILCFFDMSKGNSMLGLFLAAASGFTYAFYMVMIEKKGLIHMNPYKLSMYGAMFIVLETLLYHLVSPSLDFRLPAQAYGYMMVAAIISSFLAVVLLQRGIALLGSTSASILCLFEPITAVVCGYFFLQEELTVMKIIGCIIIMAAVVILVFAKKRPKTETQKNALSSEAVINAEKIAGDYFDKEGIEEPSAAKNDDASSDI